MRGLIKEVTSLTGTMATKPVWLCGVALSLWGLNALSLQEVCYEHRGTIAISHSRLAALDSIARKFGSGTPYRLLECQLCPEEALSKHASDMRTVRLRVRAKSHSDLLRLDAYLLEATQPQQDSAESKLILRELRSAKWIRESAAHQQMRVDCQNSICQERLAAIQTVPQSSPATGESSVPFQFVGFRSSENVDESSSEISVEDAQATDPDAAAKIQADISQLTALSQSIGDQLTLSDEQIETLSSRLDASRTHTAGYLSFTGSQEYFPIATPVGWNRLATACLVCVSAWALVGLLVQRLPVAWGECKTRIFACISSRAKFSGARRSPRGSKFKSIDLGIPCLGTIDLPADLLPESYSGKGGTAMHETVPGTEVNETMQFKMTAPKSSSVLSDLLQNAATLAIATWSLLFAIRFLVDSVWRDLFLEAPLAGIIHLLTGAP